MKSSLQAFGKYQLVQRIGVGGLAEIYEATLNGVSGFSKRLAIKQLLPQVRDDAEAIQMFIDEAAIASSLNHPNIITIFDFGQIDGIYYLAMEFMDGWDLNRFLQQYQKRSLQLPVPAAAYIVRELCYGLDYIHKCDHKIIHRDVTPHNIFVTRQGHIKLGDFGIAKSLSRLSRTLDGHIKGKLAYLAPEQVTGEFITPRTDIYAAGLILFELLTGRRLIQASCEVDFIKLATDPPYLEPSSIRNEAKPLDRIIQRALQKHPTLRYSEAALMAHDLDEFLKTSSFHASDLARLAATSAKISPKMASISAPVVINENPALPKQTIRLPAGAPAQQSVLLATSTPSASHSFQAPRVYLYLMIIGLLILVTVSGIVWFSRVRSPLVSTSQAKPGSISNNPSQPGAGSLWVDAQVEKISDAKQNLLPPYDARPGDTRLPKVLHGYKKRRMTLEKSLIKGTIGASQTISPAKTSSPPSPMASKDARILDEHQAQSAYYQLSALMSQAQARGLWPGDNPQLDSYAAEAKKFIRTGRLEEASSSMQRLANIITSFKIDRRFVEQKLARLEQVINSAQLPSEKRQNLSVISQRILRHILDGRLTEASQLISKTLAQLPR